MGWYIFFGFLILLSLPLFIPIIIKARWDEEAMEWSVHIGFLQVAPDTKIRLERWKKNFSKIFTPVGKTFKFLFSIIVLVFKALFWPIKKFRQLISSFRSTKKSHEEESDSFDFSTDHKADEEKKELASSDEEGLSPDEDLDDTIESLDVPEKTDDLVIEEIPEEDSLPTDMEDADSIEEPVSEEDFEEEASTEESEPEPEPEKKSKKEFKNPFESINKKLENFASLKEKFDLYLDYYRRYSPLGKKILRSVFRLIRRYFTAFHFQRLKIICKTGGDPAVLGAISGWHYALGYTIHPSFPERIVFLPDYEEHSVSLSGSLNISVWIWPIRFILPTLAFIFGLPWIRIYKTVREFRRRDGQS